MRNIVGLIKDCVFPIYCLGCNKEGEWLCENCLKQICPAGVFCCPVCNQNNSTGLGCRNCRSNSFLEQVISAVPYQEEELIGKIIENFKYHYLEELKTVIEIIIKKFLAKQPIINVQTIVPVPLHPRRLAERGFNQAELLAEILARELKLPIQPLLKRSRYTRQQAKLNRRERKTNVQSAFVASSSFTGAALLVDDVYTTGSTMQECARVLKFVGVKKVIGWTLARG